MMYSEYKYDVFFSYARQDIVVAKKIDSLFNRWGIRTYNNDVPPLGMDYAVSISNGIKDSSAFVLLVSEASINSAWCRKELETAIESGKTIIPISLGDTDVAKVPQNIRQYQVIDYDSIFKRPEELIHAIVSVERAKEREEYSHSNSIPQPSVFNARGSKKGNKKWLWITIAVALALFGLFWLNQKQLDYVVYGSPCGSIDSVQPPSLESPPVIQDSVSSISFRGQQENALNEISNLKKQNKHQEETIYKLQKKNERLGYVVLFVSIMVVFISFFFILARRKAKRLYTDLNIVSDAKTVAQFGESSLLIEKDGDVSVKMPLGSQVLGLNYTDYNSPKQIKCFIGGSTELQSERDALRATISVVHNAWKEKNFQIFSFTFEDFDKKFVKVEGGQQSLYDSFIENDANIAIFIIKEEVGDKTVEEFNKAYASFKKTGHPSIVVYHENESVLGSTAELLKKQVKETGQYWNNYDTLKEMKYHFQDILSTDLWRLYDKELIENSKKEYGQC